MNLILKARCTFIQSNYRRISLTSKDDLNPMPITLHCASYEIINPNRSISFLWLFFKNYIFYFLTKVKYKNSQQNLLLEINKENFGNLDLQIPSMKGLLQIFTRCKYGNTIYVSTNPIAANNYFLFIRHQFKKQNKCLTGIRYNYLDKKVFSPSKWLFPTSLPALKL